MNKIDKEFIDYILEGLEENIAEALVEARESGFMAPPDEEEKALMAKCGKEDDGTWGYVTFFPCGVLSLKCSFFIWATEEKGFSEDDANDKCNVDLYLKTIHDYLKARENVISFEDRGQFYEINLGGKRGLE